MTGAVVQAGIDTLTFLDIIIRNLSLFLSFFVFEACSRSAARYWKKIKALSDSHGIILIDYSGMDAQSLTMENIETPGRKAASQKDICRVRKCANIVIDDLQCGLVRAWEIIAELYDLVDLEIRLFKNGEEAAAWIKDGT